MDPGDCDCCYCVRIAIQLNRRRAEEVKEAQAELQELQQGPQRQSDGRNGSNEEIKAVTEGPSPNIQGVEETKQIDDTHPQDFSLGRGLQQLREPVAYAEK